MTLARIDLRDPAFLADPYPLYRQLREPGGPVWWPDDATGGAWLVTGYHDAVALLKDPRASTNLARVAPSRDRPPIDHSMLARDPPDHTRLRALVGQAFTLSRVRELEPHIAQIARGLVANIQTQREFDFMADFASPLPMTVIAELLGIPSEDRDAFAELSNKVCAILGLAGADSEFVREHAAASMALNEYFRDLIGQRRRQPRDDLLSALIVARDAGDRLTEGELLGTCILLLVAGNETTVNLLGNGMLTLLRNPGLLAWLRDHLEHLPTAIEEMLRFESPVQRVSLRVITEAVTIGGTVMEEGQRVSVVVGAANRDPVAFPDPDRFDPLRDPNRHLAFSSGMHFCLGPSLARAEARIGFEEILKQLPALRSGSEAADWLPNTVLRGLKTLPLLP
jgi:cytochrome P450